MPGFKADRFRVYLAWKRAQRMGVLVSQYLGIPVGSFPLLSRCLDDAADTWGMAVQQRLDQTRLEWVPGIKPPAEGLVASQKPVHDLADALGLGPGLGSPLEQAEAQAELARRFGVAVVAGPLPR